MSLSMRSQRRFFGVCLTSKLQSQPSREDFLSALRSEILQNFGNCELVQSQVRILHHELSPQSQSESASSISGKPGQYSESSKSDLYLLVCSRRSLNKVRFCITLLRGIHLRRSKYAGVKTSKQKTGSDEEDSIEEDFENISNADEAFYCNNTGTKAAAAAEWLPCRTQVMFNCGCKAQALKTYSFMTSEIHRCDKTVIPAWQKRVSEEVGVMT